MGKYPVLAKVHWCEDNEKGISYHIIYADSFAEAGAIIEQYHGEAAYKVSFTFLEEGLIHLSKVAYEEIEKRGI